MRRSRRVVSSVTGAVPHWSTIDLDALTPGENVVPLWNSSPTIPVPWSETCVEPVLTAMSQGTASGSWTNMARLSSTCWYCSSVIVLAWRTVLSFN